MRTKILVVEDERGPAIGLFRAIAEASRGMEEQPIVYYVDQKLKIYSVKVPPPDGAVRINEYLADNGTQLSDPPDELLKYDLVLLDLQIDKPSTSPFTTILDASTLSGGHRRRYFGACLGEWMLKKDFPGNILVQSDFVYTDDNIVKWLKDLKTKDYKDKIVDWSKQDPNGLVDQLRGHLNLDFATTFISTIRFCASTNEPVLILGESGTEKGPVAEAIHREWERKQWPSNRPFMKVNCGAFSEGHLRAELFGYVKGGISGALYHSFGKALRAAGLEMPVGVERSTGGMAPEEEFLALMKQSAGARWDDKKKPEISIKNEDIAGTLFLDEVGELPIALQKKLLSFLSSKPQVEPIGLESHTIELKRLRIIAATSNPRWMKLAGLESKEEKDEYENVRQDIYYRLARHVIRMRPLQRDDVIPMISRILTDPKECPLEAQEISNKEQNGILTDREKVSLFWEFDDKRNGIDGAVDHLIELVGSVEGLRGNMRQLRTIVRLANRLRRVSAELGRGSQLKVTKQMVDEIFQPPPRSEHEIETEPIGTNPTIMETLDNLFSVIFPTGELTNYSSALFIYLAYVVAGNKEDGERSLREFERLKRTGLKITQASLPGLNYWRTRGNKTHQTSDQKEAFKFVVDFISFATDERKPDICRSFGPKRESIGEALHLLQDIRWNILTVKLKEFLQKKSSQ